MKTDFYKMECDILVALSDFIPRNQNQITDIIGDREKSTDRVHISRCLKKLKPYLQRHRNELDEMGKKWSLKQDIETIRQIGNEYKPIISELQKSDKILSMLVDNVKFDTDLGILKEIPLFKDMLRSSPSFFENCLINDSFLKKYYLFWKEISPLSDLFEELNKTALNLKGTPLEFIPNALNEFGGVFCLGVDLIVTIKLGFEHCVIEDYLKGVSTPEAVAIVKEIKKEVYNGVSE